MIDEELKQINRTIVEIIESQKDNIDERHADYSKYENMYSSMFEQAYKELQNGQRTGPWMSYIFPIPKWESKLMNGIPHPPSNYSTFWFIPDKTGIPFLLYNVNSDQILIRKLYTIMRISYDQLSRVCYSRAVFFYDFFANSSAPIFHTPIPGTTLFGGVFEWNIFQTCVEFFLKAIAAIMNRYDIPGVHCSIWQKDGKGKQIYWQEIDRYHKAVQKAQPMEIYHEFFHLLQQIYTRITHI